MISALTKTGDGRYLVSSAAALVASQPRTRSPHQVIEAALLSGIGLSLGQHAFGNLLSDVGVGGHAIEEAARGMFVDFPV